MELNLSGQVAIVTGGASGIGRATVECFAGEGCSVAIWDVSHARNVAEEIARASAVRPDFVGLTCPDRYVFGYGMDLRGLWRNLDHIRALDPA